MIVDTSALVAILKSEPEAPAIRQALAGAERPKMSTATYLEAGIVVDRNRQPLMSARLDEIITDMGIELQPVSASQAFVARQAYRKYGKGMGHKAQLNFGDCFSYALALETREPLLFKGDDFGHTDLRSAL